MDKLRILFAEDVSTDREMVERLLKQNGIEFISECVDTEPEFTIMLKIFDPTLILSDYKMPTFDGMKALTIAQKEKPEVPFIILTGSMNEDIAVECMKNGADDYVIKQNLKRLIPSLKSAIEKKRLQRAEKSALNHLQESELKYRLLVENTPNAVFLSTSKKLLFINERFSEFFEYTIDELNTPEFDLYSLITPSHREKLAEKKYETETDKQKVTVVNVDILSKTGKIRFCEFTLIPFIHEDKIHYQGILKDLSLKKQLLMRNIMLSQAIEQSTVGVLITDNTGIIEYINSGFSQQTGFSFEEMTGKKANFLNAENHDEIFSKNILETISSGENWKGEIINKKKSGELFHEKLSVSPIYDSDGKIIHFLAIMEDISVLKKTIKDLKVAKEKAEESDQLKTAFLTNISHEIRTPMNGILGFTDLLKTPSLSIEQMDSYIEIIQKSGERMLNTINDIIDISKIESGSVSLEYIETNIQGLINELQLFFEHMATEKNIHFEVKHPEIIIGPIITDSNKVYSILSNLINNAIKFTQEGYVKVTYTKIDNHILFLIEDTGIGIPKDREAAVFDRFVQADASLSRAYEGSGLGLSIAKSYATMLKANIWFESEPNVGTKFYLNLPIDNNQTEKNTNSALISEPGYSLKNLNILVVEDDTINTQYLMALLDDIKSNIVCVENGIEAIEIINSNTKKFDVVLMDLNMPIMNGYDATSEILKNHPYMKIIAQTAFASPSDKERCLRFGFANYISKPFTEIQLTNIIKETIFENKKKY